MKLSTDTLERTLQIVEEIGRKLGILPGILSPKRDMAVVTSTIGTTGRDYSTITAWEADLDNTGIYNAADDAVGECYADSNFDEAVTINGGSTVGLNSIRLTAASGQEHDGTAGSGVACARSTPATVFTLSSTVDTTVEWMDITIGGTAGAMVGISCSTGAGDMTIQRNLAHSYSTSNNSARGITSVQNTTGYIRSFQNNIVYDIETTAGGTSRLASGINSQGGATTQHLLNNTAYNIVGNINSGGSGYVAGIRLVDVDATNTVKNNVAAAVTCSGTQTPLCFDMPSTFTSATNASDDSTAPSPIASEPIAAATEFVSTTGGSEDLHLKSGAECIDTGTDLATTPSGVEIDINGRDRDASGDTWDVGAHEFVAVGGAAVVGALINGGLINSGLINGGLI